MSFLKVLIMIILRIPERERAGKEKDKLEMSYITKYSYSMYGNLYLLYYDDLHI